MQYIDHLHLQKHQKSNPHLDAALSGRQREFASGRGKRTTACSLNPPLSMSLGSSATREQAVMLREPYPEAKGHRTCLN